MTETFKPLDEFLKPDERMKHFGGIDSVTRKFMPARMEQHYSAVQGLALPDAVPVAVREYFDATRTLWMYGWFYYAFFSWAGLHAGMCAEMALYERLIAEGLAAPDGTRSLKFAFGVAIKHGWLSDSRFAHAERLRDSREERQRFFEEAASEAGLVVPPPAPAPSYVSILLETFPALRNSQAHPALMSFGFPGPAFLTLELTRDLISQLYSSPVKLSGT